MNTHLLEVINNLLLIYLLRLKRQEQAALTPETQYSINKDDL